MARQPKHPHPRPAKNPENESGLEAYKQELFEAATAQTAFLTGCYVNWLNSQAALAKMETARPAWIRAKGLFETLAPVVLHELVHEIARQVELEFQSVDAFTAAHVAGELRNLSFLELMEHVN